MNILVFNAGSSTLKFQVRRLGTAANVRLAQGLAESRGFFHFAAEGGHTLEGELSPAEARSPLGRILDWVGAAGLSGVAGLQDIGAAGHRVVHGGGRFPAPAILDDAAIAALDGLSDLAPLHNPPALRCIQAARERLPGVPMVAVFDTSFHRTMPDRAALYALPRQLATQHGVQRYGFHGIAHRWMAGRYAEIVGKASHAVSLVTLQLGNGCSAAAIENGESIDTSMGFSPLEGLVMGSRSGDIDPSVVPYLAKRDQVSSETILEWLNERSGLLGVSGRSEDMRVLQEAAAEGDQRAELAIEMFCYRARKYVGAYLAALGGAETVVFGGGIGEHSSAVRRRICQGLEWMGLTLDPSANDAAIGREARISAPGSPLAAWVIPVDEEALIARDTFALLSG